MLLLLLERRNTVVVAAVAVVVAAVVVAVVVAASTACVFGGTRWLTLVLALPLVPVLLQGHYCHQQQNYCH